MSYPAQWHNSKEPEFEAIAAKMEGGVGGFGKFWGYYDFARAVLKARDSKAADALKYALSGLDLAYECLEARRYDEAMLHCGHHHAMVARALKAIDDMSE